MNLSSLLMLLLGAVLGVLVGWLYKSYRVRPVLFDLRRQTQINKVGTRSQGTYSQDNSEIDLDVDELYQTSARVKPLEYDLAHRMQEVKALKHALVSEKNNHEKKILSLRGNMEKQISDRYLEKMSDQQKRINDLSQRLEQANKAHTTTAALKANTSSIRVVERERDEFREQNEAHLNNIQVLLQQANTVEEKRKEMQVTLAEARRDHADMSDALSQATSDLRLREKELIDVTKQLGDTEQTLNEHRHVKAELNEVTANLTQAEALIVDLQEDVNASRQHLRDREIEIDALNQQLTESADQVSEFAQQLNVAQSESQEVPGLKQSLSDRNQEIQNLTNLLNEARLYEVRYRESMRETELLSEQVVEMGAMRSVIVERDKTIAALEDAARQADDSLRILDDLRGENEILHKEVQQIAPLEKQVRAQESDIESLHKEAEQASVQVSELLETIKSNEEQLRQYGERVSHEESLNAALSEKDQHIENLRKQSARVMTIEAALKTKTAELENADKALVKANSELAKLDSELAKTNNSTNEKLSLLENQIIEKDLELAKFAEYEARLSDRDKQLMRIREDLQQKSKEIERLSKADTELEQSRLQIDALNKSLTKAEQDSSAAQENDLELRRLRSEMQSLQAEKEHSVRLETDINRRDQKIAELQARLSAVQNPESESKSSFVQKTDTAIKRAVPLHAETPSKSATTPNVTNSSSTTPLFVATKDKDNLKKINGIGPVIERQLKRLGIVSFKQIANFTESDIAKVTEAIDAFPGRIERDDWIGGAKVQYRKKYKSEVDIS